MPLTRGMYSTEWFKTFAATVPAALITVEIDALTASVGRRMHGSRCFHEITYNNGRVDDIQFDVYQPDEIRDLCLRVKLEPGTDMVRWDSKSRPSADCPRYQLISVRRE